jgi:hypothetical protein
MEQRDGPDLDEIVAVETSEDEENGRKGDNKQLNGNCFPETVVMRECRFILLVNVGRHQRSSDRI